MSGAFRFGVLRPDDFLALEFEFVNFRLHTEIGEPARLRRIADDGDAFLVVHFPAQHVAEEAIEDSGGGTPNPTPPLRGRLAGPSRLAFSIPTSIDEIPYTMETLLDWSSYEPVLATGPESTLPSPHATAIEAPYRLLLSANGESNWNPTAPPTRDEADPIPLWHVDLRSDAGQPLPTMRAIWAHTNLGEEPGYRISLKKDDRQEIVDLSSNFGIPAYDPQPIDVRRLQLTSMGAWLDLSAQWEPPPPYTREAWQHRATMGRDQAVTIIERGNLFPYGHRASLVIVTRRIFADSTHTHSKVAILLQQVFVVPREIERSYEALPARDGRAIPFRQVQIATRISPPIEQHHENPHVFWPRSHFEDVQFDLIGIDWDGNACPFTTPLMFVANGFSNDAEIQSRFAEPPNSRRRPRFHGQSLAYAKSSGRDGARGDTVLFTGEIEFGGRLSNGPGAPFFPAMKEANVRVRALEVLASGGPTPTIAFNDVYLLDGFGSANVGEVFVDVMAVGGSHPAMALRADQAGGLGAPRLVVQGLSRSLGPVGAGDGGIAAVAHGTFPGPDGTLGYLKDVLGDTKILGILPLADLVSLDTTGALDQLPTTQSYEADGKLISTFRWKTGLQKWKTQNRRATLDLGVILTSPSPQAGQPHPEPTFAVNGTLNQLELRLIPNVADVMVLHFERITFSSGTGIKPAFDARVARDAIEFIGPLSFLTELKEMLGSSLGGLPGVDTGPSGVKVTYSLGIPTIAVGIFSLQNISILAGLELPFSESSKKAPVRLRFAFCERHRPFLLTVSLFGGGGFVGLEITPAGLALLEASLEFGASVALNLGIASGSVTVMAGIYFRLELQGPANKQGVQLTGYFRCNGSLEVLSIIRISAEFYLGLTWKDPKAWGLARLTVEIEIAFFSKSVSLEVERQFSGTSADPTFSDLVERDDWFRYLEAFA